ncbi:MAG: YkgJ family cysteine cluster protein, partial [Planctomycetales bacterium]|nr:YkgJ family cysteine cluster protein [Planctomycetales bacterium]
MSKSLPLELPQLQNWSCHTCGGCCKQHGIYITAEERQRIIDQGWTEADGIPADQPLFVEMGHLPGRKWWRLAHQPDGSCVFLDERGLCKIHGKFGEPAKPLACRIYPYAFHPAGDYLAVGLRFSCPSVVENLGTPVVEQRSELQRLARLVVPEGARATTPPKLTDKQPLTWEQVLQLVDAFDTILAQEDHSVIAKLLQAVQLTDLLTAAKIESFAGKQFVELLQLMLDAVATESCDSAAPQPPRGIVGTQFRLLAGQYARKDTYSTQITWGSRWSMLWAGWALARGRGNTPALQARLQSVPFASL